MLRFIPAVPGHPQPNFRPFRYGNALATFGRPANLPFVDSDDKDTADEAEEGEYTRIRLKRNTSPLLTMY